MSQSGEARTQRLDPSLMALTIISPPSISTSAWLGRPASKILAAPDCDTELVAYEMSVLVEAAGEVLSPALRGSAQGNQQQRRTTPARY